MSYLGLETIKPTKPIKRGDLFVFPKTTADQVLMDEDTEKTLSEEFAELNTILNNINGQNVLYKTSDVDNFLEKYANTTGYIFGHSDTLSGKCGYWVFVIMLGAPQSGYYAQIAIGTLGIASRIYNNSSWSDWVKD